ncbi:putative ribonuclease H protein [Senna tora]|uniref:Putative ribonuclease H protein n=1 Tax=Senna tora TaxID=362788 RepID=A0A834TLG8_9FABA|nr:putative ribonuclease H protein [Senna tora]
MEGNGKSLTAEEQDNLCRSKKKFKPDNESGAGENGLQPATSDTQMSEMEASPITQNKHQEEAPNPYSNQEGHEKEEGEAEASTDYNDQSIIIDNNRQFEVGREAFGPWMLVTPRGRRRPSIQKKDIPNNPYPRTYTVGSRFAAINIDEETEMEIDEQIKEEGDQERKTPVTIDQEPKQKTETSTKNLSINTSSKSPAKQVGVPKAPTKHPTDEAHDKGEMDSKMKEQLQMMKIIEKQYGLIDSSLSQLGATQKSLLHHKDWSSFCNCNEREWIKLNLSNCFNKNRIKDWGSFFGTACWLIWRQRNDWLFNNKHNRGLSLLPQIEYYYNELAEVAHIKRANQNWVVNPFEGWSPPAEDSVLALQLVSDAPLSGHPLHQIIAKIQELMRRSWDIRIRHVDRDRNSVADCLAKFAHSLNFVPQVYKDPLPICRNVYEMDLRKLGFLPV